MMHYIDTVIAAWFALPFWATVIIWIGAAILGIHVIRWALSSMVNTIALMMLAFGAGFFLVERGLA